METETLVTLLVTGCCLVAIGSMAGSLETTIPGDPTRVVDVDGETLPLPGDRVGALKRAFLTEAGDGDATRRTDGGGDGGGDAGTAETEPTAASAPAPNESLWRRLLGYLLQALLGAVAIGGVYYRREWLRTRLRALGRPKPTATGEPPEAPEPVPRRTGRPPNNEVERRWLAMVERACPSVEPHQTPRERLALAIEAGADPEAATELTELYEAVRYGGQPVTRHRIETATALAERASEAMDG